MKRLLLSLVAILCIGLTSCKKDYTCTCTTIDTDPNWNYTETVTYNFTAKKKDAESLCSRYESSYSSGAYTVTTTCDLK